MNTKSETIKSQFLALKAEIGDILDGYKTGGKTHLQNYLYFFYYPLFSFAESIIILCENGKHHSAKVLLRSLFEAHINILYHQIKDSERRVAISAKSGLDSKIRNIKEVQALIKKYPNLESKDCVNLYNNVWLQNADQWAQRELQAILKENNLQKNDRDISLKEKAIKCDQEFTKTIERGHFERMYDIIYRQLSPVSHLDIEGIQTFVNQNEAGKYLFSDEDNPDLVISEAVNICLAFTKDLYESKVIEGEITSTVSRIEKLTG